MAFLVLSLAHLLLIPLAVRETARPLADLVRVAYSFSSSCGGEGQEMERWRKGWDTALYQCSDVR